MLRIVVIAALLVPQLSHADWSPTPPSGWKRSPGKREQQHAKRWRSIVDHPVRVQVREWQAPGGRDHGILLAMHWVMRDPEDTPDDLADGMATGLGLGYLGKGFESRHKVDPPATIDGQARSIRLYESDTTRVHLQVRARAAKSGAIHALLVVCETPIAVDGCVNVLRSIKLD